MAEQFTRSIVVKASPSTAFNLWANFENFPHFMDYIKKVTKTGADTSQWQMAGPLGIPVVWEAELTRLEPNSHIAWNTKANSGLTTSGEVAFNKVADDETSITVTVQYDAPAGKLGDLIGKLFANPEGRLEEDLKNFKQYAEGRQLLS